MTLRQIRIGTRKSPLAIAQAEEVCDRLKEEWPDLEIGVIGITTSGDILEQPLAEVGGKGLFSKELEEALLAKRIDMAVHSVKDMQTVLPDGLILGCMLEREDPRDMLVGENLSSFDDLPEGALFGTSSQRRAAQALMRRRDLKIVPMRGNVQTRLDKLAKGEVQATMLAKAGLNRLDLHDVPGTLLSADDFIPAVGQGALGIECLSDNEQVLEWIAPLADVETEKAVLCERAFLAMLDGSCRTPIAGYASITGGQLHFRGLIARPDGSAYWSVETSGSADDAETLGAEAGQELLKKAAA